MGGGQFEGAALQVRLYMFPILLIYRYRSIYLYIYIYIFTAVFPTPFNFPRLGFVRFPIRRSLHGWVRMSAGFTQEQEPFRWGPEG